MTQISRSKKVTIFVYLVLALLLTTNLSTMYSQTIYYIFGNGPYLKKAADIPPGASVWTAINGVPSQMYVVTPTLMAVRDPAVYARALSDCNAKLLPIIQRAGFATNCDGTAEAATQDDRDRRVAAAVAQIPIAVLQANKMFIVQ